MVIIGELYFFEAIKKTRLFFNSELLKRYINPMVKISINNP